MAEREDWTPADDDLVRRALITLRTDVESVPLADPRFVRSRGARLRRQRLLTWTAAAAVAAVVAGTAGYAALASRPEPTPAPASRTGVASTTPSPSATTATSSLDQPGALPLLQEWTRTLDLTGHARLTRVSAIDHECLATNPRGQVQREQMTVDGLAFEGGQTRFSVDSATDPQTVAEGIASDVAACQAGPGFAVKAQTASGWPRLFSYTAGSAGSGWFAVVPGAHDVTLLQVVDPAHQTSAFTRPQVAALADIAEQRLARYGTSATPSHPSATTPSSGPKAINESMPVSGVAPLLSSDLFVAASQWTSPWFAKGAKASAAGGAQEGSSTVVECETDSQQAGIGGRYGIVTVRASSGDANVIGKQRVRLFEDVDAASLAAQDVKGLDQLVMKGCRQGQAVTTATRGTQPGTYLLATTVGGPDGSGVQYQWVGVTLQHTTGAVTTIVFHGTSHGQGFTGTASQGFSELARLLALARQK
jgi:hypothetical protein